MCQTRPVTTPDVAFITGASRGIGRSLALSLASDGMTVVGFARPSDDLDSLPDAGGSESVIHIRPVDVSHPDEVQRVFREAVREFDAPTLLTTCAGSAVGIGPITSVDPAAWWQDVTVDLRGTMLCVKAVLGPMLNAGRGRVVTVYGNLGDNGREHVSAFAAAKAGIARFTEILATEVAGSGVVALSIHPGFVRTPMTERLAWSEDGRSWLPEFRSHAEQHWGDGSGAVDLVRRIAAGEADELAGRVVHVGDDLQRLAELARSDEHLRRLRMGLK